MLLSKKATSVSVIRTTEKSVGQTSNHSVAGPPPSNRTSSNTYDTIDGQSISPRLPANSTFISTNQQPHYEKPMINHNKPKTLIRNGNANNLSQTLNHGKQPLPIPKSSQLLDDVEVNQIELFYRSQKTYVFVSRSMANLYFTQTDLINNGRCVVCRSLSESFLFLILLSLFQQVF